MKRKDLQVGMEVEIQHGRGYRVYQRAVVLAVEPWVEAVRSPLTRAGMLRRPARDGDARAGVAVAVLRQPPPFSRDRESRWEPEVVSLSQVVPTGSKAAYEAGQEAARVARDQADEQRRERDAELHARFKAILPAGHLSIWERDCTLSIRTLEALLDLAERVDR